MNQAIKIGKSQKIFGQRIGKRYYKTLGTSVINSPLSPLSLSGYNSNSLHIFTCESQEICLKG